MVISDWTAVFRSSSVFFCLKSNETDHFHFTDSFLLSFVALEWDEHAARTMQSAKS